VSDDEKAAWNASQHVATDFLGNVKTFNFRKHVEDLITSYEKLGQHVTQDAFPPFMLGFLSS
jgi:hypothetical protein